MYWPIGAPRIYAASKHANTPRTAVKQSQQSLHNASQSSKTAEAGQTHPQETVGAKHEEDNRSASEASNEVNEQSIPSSQKVDDTNENVILSAKASRGGSIFTTITRSALSVWQTKPTLVLASVTRSAQSIKAYGPNSALLLRPDALVIAVQTTQNFLVVYSVAADPNARVYTTELPSNARHVRKGSVDGYQAYRKHSSSSVFDAGGPMAEADGVREVNLRFRMVMRIDAGISTALALDDELVVATEKPAALQCISWPTADVATTKKGAQTRTELLTKIPWVGTKCNVTEMVHDRPMNLTCWITSDGCAYAVQRRTPANVDMDNPASLFQGYCFREPDSDEAETYAIKAAINARFSLIAVGCADGKIDVYIVKDYMGNIPISHKVQISVPSTASGRLECLNYSPDGYCLFAGYEKGWAMWSVYGQAGASSFIQDPSFAVRNDELYLRGTKDAFWIGGGCEIMILPRKDDRLWSFEIARGAVTGCFSQANLLRGLLVSSGHLKIYKGHDVPDPMSLASDTSLWQTVQIPASYLLAQWPIKAAVISPDGNYIAVAGRRGLAHYNTVSGRWRTFEDPDNEREFTIRGGMCWFRRFLIACVECDADGKRFQTRVYSREKPLSYANIQHSEALAAPAVFMATSGVDSLLVYTHDNNLLHFIIAPSAASVKLVQVGQIGFHGIIRAPPRVRSISWLLSEDSLEHDDPSQDVTRASVLFLVDGKLVLLQPGTNEQGELKYDMRVIAQNVEYYILPRDLPVALASLTNQTDQNMLSSHVDMDGPLTHSLSESLWFFDGTSFQVWHDMQDLLACASADLSRDLPRPVQIPVDFYPLFPVATNGIVNGLDTDLAQRRDVDFSFFRLNPRTQLFLPQLLGYHLTEYNSPAALHLSQAFMHLPYFPHALEILLHNVLDAEVDSPPVLPETALLPTVISFLSSFPCYLEVVVNCTRKTELRSWRTLFSYLPPVLELFEESLLQCKLKTAAGYLLVLHTLQGDEEVDFHGVEYARLLKAATDAADWELCGEVARFLVGIDHSGETLRMALSGAGLKSALNGSGDERRITDGNERQRAPSHSGDGGAVGEKPDYFSLQPVENETEMETYLTPST